MQIEKMLFIMRKMLLRAILALFVVVANLLVPNKLHAQLNITPGSSLTGWTPDSLVRNVLLGAGVEVFNVTFNGSSNSINCNGVGVFSTGASATNLGMEEGFILSASAMSYINSTTGQSTHNCPTYSDVDLVNTVHSWGNSFSVNNQSVLEFDFIPRADSIKFRYVFASEEYHGYECTQYNDIFAFFISGLNPSGGMYNSHNIAVVPGTSTPITISTINGGTSYGSVQPCILNNTQYYNDNTSQTYIKHMDGMTTVLTAEARVVPCTQYHMKMAVANVSDESLPSCVFLEANSLVSNGLTFTVDNFANPDNPNDLYEGCVAYVHMTRPRAISTPTRIDVTIEGDVSNGVDFDQWPTYFYFPADSTSFSMAIQPYQDSLEEGIEGVENARFIFQEHYSLCSDTFDFRIIDTQIIKDSISRDTLDCRTQMVKMRANITGGMPNRMVKWTNLGNDHVLYGDSIYVRTLPKDSLWLCEVEDSCRNYASDTMLIGIRYQFGRLVSDSTTFTGDTIICAHEPLDLVLRGADSCVWYKVGTATPIELRDSVHHVAPGEDCKYIVYSYKWWNNQYWEDVDSISIFVVPLPQVSITVDKDRICEGQSMVITASGADKYSWDGGQTFVTDASKTYTPDSTDQYLILGLTNNAECYGRDSLIVIVDTIPEIVVSDGTGVCGGESAELTVDVEAESFAWTANPSDPSLVGQETRHTIYINPPSTTVYTVTAHNGVCSNSASTTVAVEPMPIAIGQVTPLTVSLGQMEATFTDVSQHSTTRTWEFPGGEMFYEKEVKYLVPDDLDSMTVRLWAYNPYLCFDTTTVTVYVDHTTIWIPNAFTPEESTNNTFLVKTNDIQRYHIFIYDRRGQLVFESYDPEKPWTGVGQNGQKCPQGVYTYLISCHKITHPYDQILRKGTVVLIR